LETSPICIQDEQLLIAGVLCAHITCRYLWSAGRKVCGKSAADSCL